MLGDQAQVHGLRFFICRALIGKLRLSTLLKRVSQKCMVLDTCPVRMNDESNRGHFLSSRRET